MFLGHPVLAISLDFLADIVKMEVHRALLKEFLWKFFLIELMLKSPEKTKEGIRTFLSEEDQIGPDILRRF